MPAISRPLWPSAMSLTTCVSDSYPGSLGYRAWGPRGFFNRGSTRIGHSHAEGRFGIAIRTTRNTRHDWLYRR